MTDQKRMLLMKPRLLILALAIGSLHIVGLGLLVAAAAQGQWLFGLGGLAYLLGVRHAFDIDHIAAIDNVTRKLSHDGQKPVFVGFAFSLGHSTVVFGLCLAMLLTLGHLGERMSWFSSVGGVFGGLVSASFLTAIAAVNAVILVRLIGRLRQRNGAGDVADRRTLDAMLDRRGFFSRALGGLYRRIDSSWKLYPLGLLFGLGFDTATEIAVLGMSAVAIQQGILSGWMIMALPLLFAAGMTLMDSINGLLMLRAYVWGEGDYRRRLRFNIVMTGLSVAIAALIALMQWLDIGTQLVAPDSGLAAWIGGAHVDLWGALVLAGFLLIWMASAGYQRRFARSRVS